MALAFDGSAVNATVNGGVGQTVSASISTSGADRIIVALIQITDPTTGDPGTTISGIADGQSLTWHKRAHISQNYLSRGVSMETWWAHAPSSLSSDSVIVTAAGSTTPEMALTLFAVSGANVTAPWDGAGGLPFTMSGFSSGGSVERVPVGIHTTINTDSTLFVFVGTNNNITGSSALSSPWTKLTDVQDGAGDGVSTSTWYQAVTATQNNLTTDLSSFNGTNLVVITDAMVPAGSTPGSDIIAINGQGYYQNQSGVGSAVSAYITNQNSTDLLVGYFDYDSGSGSPSISVADTAGNSWTKLCTVLDTTSRNNSYMDVWYAKCSAAVDNNKVTATLNTGNFIQQGIQIVSIANADPTSPFDSGSPFTASDNSGTTNQVISGISSTVNNGMLLVGAWSDWGNAFISWSGASNPSLINLGSTNSGGGSDWNSNGLSFGVFSSALSGYTTGNSDNSIRSWAAAAVVVKQAIVIVPFILDVDEGAYTITGSPTGNILSAAPGSYTITGDSSSGDVTGITLGLAVGVYTITGSPSIYTPIYGVWASTDAKDVMALSGTVTVPMELDTFEFGGAGDTGGGPLTSTSITLSTNHADEIIVLHSVSGGFFASAPISTVTDTAGLVWKRRQFHRLVGSQPYEEIWWAHAPDPLSADEITVNFESPGTGACALTAFGVTGCNVSGPWDLNTQAPRYYDNNGGNNMPVSNMYTSASKTFTIGLFGTEGVGDDGTIGSPMTYVGNNTASEHSGRTVYQALAYGIFDSALDDFGMLWGHGGGFQNWAYMTDALVANGESGTNEEVSWEFDSASFNAAVLAITSTDQIFNISCGANNSEVVAIVQILIASASGLGTVSGIIDTKIGVAGGFPASPGFERRSRVTNATGTLAMETWWCYNPGQPNGDTLSIQTENTASGDTIAALGFCVVGATFAQAPAEAIWDGDSMLPDEVQGTTGFPNGQISTIAQHTLSLTFTGNLSVDETGDIAQPFFNFNAMASAGPAANLAIGYIYNHAPVTDETFSWDASPAPTPWLVLADALIVGPPIAPTGQWVSTEAKDTFTHTGDYSSIGIFGPGGWVGYVPATAVLAATDAKDTPGGAPAQDPYDSVGWLGWVPAFGTLVATDAKDHSALGGYILGPAGITGRWSSTDAKDRPSISNIAAVTGTMNLGETPDRFASTAYLIPKGSPPAPRRRRMLIIT